jgi:hypothetical protein
LSAVPSALDLVSGYRDAAAQLQSKTKVPLRLPTWVPYDDDKDNPLYAIVDTATPAGYELQLAWIPDCNGAHVCRAGFITGSSSALPESNGRRIPVTLDSGVKGYFIEVMCGVYCDDASINWTEGNSHYSISMKGGIEGRAEEDGELCAGFKMRV